jgi:hypothetical protein
MKTWMYFLFGLAILILFSFLYGGEKVVVRHGPVMNGVNIEAPSKPYDSSAFITIKNTHSNWVALIPYAFTSIESADVFFDNERQWWGERSEGIIASVKMAHDQGLQVMIKPHLWVKKQGWAG